MSVYFYFHLGFINFFPHADAASAVKKKKKKLQKTSKNSKKLKSIFSEQFILFSYKFHIY